MHALVDCGMLSNLVYMYVYSTAGLRIRYSNSFVGCVMTAHIATGNCIPFSGSNILAPNHPMMSYGVIVSAQANGSSYWGGFNPIHPIGKSLKQ